MAILIASSLFAFATAPLSNWHVGTGDQAESTGALVFKSQEQKESNGWIFFLLFPSYRRVGVGGGVVMEDLEMKEGERKTYNE